MKESGEINLLLICHITQPHISHYLLLCKAKYFFHEFTVSRNIFWINFCHKKNRRAVAVVKKKIRKLTWRTSRSPKILVFRIFNIWRRFLNKRGTLSPMYKCAPDVSYSSKSAGVPSAERRGPPCMHIFFLSTPCWTILLGRKEKCGPRAEAREGDRHKQRRGNKALKTCFKKCRVGVGVGGGRKKFAGHRVRAPKNITGVRKI